MKKKRRRPEKKPRKQEMKSLNSLMASIFLMIKRGFLRTRKQVTFGCVETSMIRSLLPLVKIMILFLSCVKGKMNRLRLTFAKSLQELRFRMTVILPRSIKRDR